MRTKTKSLFTILFGLVFALALGCMAMSVNATPAKADGTVFRMTNKAYLRLNADGYAFEVEMDEATHASVAANDNLYFIIMPAKYLKGGTNYASAIARTDGVYNPTSSHCIYVKSTSQYQDGDMWYAKCGVDQ